MSDGEELLRCHSGTDLRRSWRPDTSGNNPPPATPGPGELPAPTTTSSSPITGQRSSQAGGSIQEIPLNQTDLDRIYYTTSMLSGLHRPALRADRTETSIPYRGKIVNARDPAILISLQTVIDELNRIIRSGGAGAAIPPVREHKALKNKKK